MSIVVTPIPRLIDLAAPAFTLGTANAAGSAETAVASDSTLLAFDTTLPAATGTAAVGTATVAPRRDHVHTGTTLAAPSLTLGTSNSAGAATTAFATNSTILAFDTTDPDAITYGQSGAVGSAVVASRRDHSHGMQAVALGAAKQWSNHNPTGAIQQSFNTTSTGKDSTGVYTITIATDFASTNYSVITSTMTSAGRFTSVAWNQTETLYKENTYNSAGSLEDVPTSQLSFGAQ